MWGDLAAVERTTDREAVPSQCEWECVLRKDKGLVFTYWRTSVVVNALVMDKDTVQHLKP